jgi:hypothetical protein
MEAGLVAAVLMAHPMITSGADPAPPLSSQPVVQSPSADAQIRMLQNHLSALEKKLADSESQCAQLQAQNAALLKRLGEGPGTPPESEGNSLFSAPSGEPGGVTAPAPDAPEAIAIPDTQWSAEGADAMQKLTSGLIGTAIKLTPCDATLLVKPVDAGHLSLSVHKTSKGLGTDSVVEAGKLWIDNGSLYLQWNRGDQSMALQALRYASLEVGDNGTAGKAYSLMKCQEVVVQVRNREPVRLELPANLAAKGKLVMTDPPQNWRVSTGDDGRVVLSQNDLKVEIEIDTTTPTLLVKCSDPDPDHAQRRLDALNKNYAKDQAELERLQPYSDMPPAVISQGRSEGSIYYPPQAEDRSQLNNSIQNDKQQMAGMDKERPKLEAEVTAAAGRTAALDQLDGTVVLLTLANGVSAVHVTLQNAIHQDPDSAK